MPPAFRFELCVCVCGPIFQVRLNFSTDDRGTKDDRGEEEEGEGGGYRKSVKKTKNKKAKKTKRQKTKKRDKKTIREHLI